MDYILREKSHRPLSASLRMGLNRQLAQAELLNQNEVDVKSLPALTGNSRTLIES